MDEDAYRRARARVEARLGFYWHATVYLAVNGFLAFLNLTRSPEHLWFQWPLFGWGIGLVSHGLGVFASSWGAARKERMIQREMEREARQRQTPPQRGPV
jgi:hypothetical protein